MVLGIARAVRFFVVYDHVVIAIKELGIAILIEKLVDFGRHQIEVRAICDRFQEKSLQNRKK